MERYNVWGTDKLVYGPVAAELLADWTRDQRVTRETWVYDKVEGLWITAGNVDFLRPLIDAQEGSAKPLEECSQEAGESTGFELEQLRQFKIFADLPNHHLEQVRQFCDTRLYSEGQTIVQRGDPGKSLFLIIQGKVVAKISVGQKEESLAEISSGDFFGELALFTRLPRSADVVALEDTVASAISFDALELMAKEIPELSSRVVIRMASILAQRIVEDNKRYQRRIASEFLWM